MNNKTVKKLIRAALTISILLCCASLFCSCHVFAWYIPKPYDEKTETKIYDFIKNDLLTNPSDYIASVSYYLPNESGDNANYNVFRSEDKTIINYTIYPKEGSPTVYGVWYDGERKEWDAKNKRETVTQVNISQYEFLFDHIEHYAEFLKTRIVNAASFSEDSYFWECFPWGMGMAQMYYDDVDGMKVTGSWTVEKKHAVKNDNLPIVFNANFDCSSEQGSIGLDVYGSPYGIDERINNILNNYEESKKRPSYIEDVNVYLTINDNKLKILLYDNDATRALVSKLEQSDITITADDYGGFEKIGNLGFTLPHNDELITADTGDVMLYQGNSIVLFYGENSWEYTRLGAIVGYSSGLIKEILSASQGKIHITLSLT